ncbi:unnamed protein product [Meganyctiphanes norvegica]|uniref:Uncharacterized protein n=1 Tax=Meganyctiphanes norvegica TaxID=48144 RepID=A0AAV2QYT9_MEGNR
MSKMNLIGGANNIRRLSIPDIKSNLKDITGSPRKRLNPDNNDYGEIPDGSSVILSKSRLTMDRAQTPEPTCDYNLKPDAFADLRPVSPQYIPQYQRQDSMGDSDEFSDNEEDIHLEKSPKLPRMQKDSTSVEEQQFRMVKSKNKRNRYLVKVPIENKANKKCVDPVELNDLTCARYPTCMQQYKRGVSPTGQMNLVELDEPSLTSLRVRAKLRMSNNIRKNMEIIQLRFAATAMETELEQMEKEIHESNEPDLLHMMGDDGKIIWKNIDDAGIEAALDSDIESMPTLEQNKFQSLDPEDILDAFLTEKYIILETESPISCQQLINI